MTLWKNTLIKSGLVFINPLAPALYDIYQPKISSTDKAFINVELKNPEDTKSFLKGAAVGGITTPLIIGGAILAVMILKR